MHSALPRVQVAPDGRSLVQENGAPFFWLGDTAWELFHRLDRDQARLFLETRAAQRFTVIQAVALAECDGLHTPNAYGHTPLVGDDPLQPNEPYWAHVDAIIDMAASLGLYIGLVPTWGDKVTPMWGAGPMVFTLQNAAGYAAWLAQRYGARPNVLWILGGDRPPVLAHGNLWLHADSPTFDALPIWRAMAAAIKHETDGAALISYHPPGGASSADWLHHEPWLDMNMLQSGHGGGHDVAVWAMIQQDYQREPAKPTLDSEPNYEDHPVNPWPTWDPASGYFRDHDLRKQCYRSILAGGCGVTYGHHAVWQFYDPARHAPITYPDRPWQQALDRPGAQHMAHLRRLFESRPLRDLIPDQSLLITPAGEGGQHVQAAREAAGRYLLVYLPESVPVELRLSDLRGAAHAWWFDPRTGAAHAIGQLASQGTQRFTPPAPGPDWLLVIDSAAAGLGAPGT